VAGEAVFFVKQSARRCTSVTVILATTAIATRKEMRARLN